MSVLFLTSLFPNEFRAEIANNSKGPIANANDTLQWALLEGMSNYYNDFSVINAPNIGAFPTRYKKLNTNFSSFVIPSDKVGLNVGFFNLIGLKHVSRFININKEIIKWTQKNSSDNVIIVYDLHVPFLLAARAAKIANPHYKLCLIVPDLHGLTGGPDNLLHKIFGYFEKKVIDDALEYVDCYVLLSEFMKEHLPIRNKPYTVVEGIYSTQKEQILQKRSKNESEEKVIFYSGALDERNGILRLIKAFSQIEKANYKLIICGDGSARNEVENSALKDLRIDFKGQIARSEVLIIQQKCTLLVNPRPPEGEFTKYSFPSKTMEYFASNVPTLMYKLEGIPNEYYNYCYYLEDLSIDALKEKIIFICEQSQDLLNQMGLKAREYVIVNKNPKYQVGKILELIEKVCL